jgi:peptide/nickel transport system permease protein
MNRPRRATSLPRLLARPLRFLAGHPAAATGIVLLAIFAAIAILAPEIAPYGQQQQVGPPFGAPSGTHPLGLDDIGRDMLSLLIWGAQISMLIGFIVALVSVLIGASIGMVAGYTGGWLDTGLVAITDYFLVLPILPLAIVAAALWGPSLRNEIVIISVLSWPMTTRVVRAQVKSLRERAFVQRARALGASHLRIMSRHILPAVSPLLVASMVITVGNAIFFEAALSFLGLGDPSKITWGKMIADAFDRGATSVGAWWAIVPPGIAIGLVVLGTSLFGRSFEESMNPRLSVSHLGARAFRIRELREQSRVRAR